MRIRERERHHPARRRVLLTAVSGLVVALGMVTAASRSTLAQVAPAGGEFQVNTFSAADQANPAAATLASGDFVIAWNSAGQDGDNQGVFARILDVSGTPRAAEFQVNTYTAGHQERPAVAATADGGFVIVWESLHQDESHEGVYGQRFDAAGLPSGTEFRVNTFTADDQADPVIAAAPDGDFVVVWRSLEQDGDDDGIFGQAFTAGGARKGPEFRVNTTTVDRQRDPAVAVAADGGFVVVWGSRQQDGAAEGVIGRRFDGGGAPRGPEFVVNTYTTGAQRAPAVAIAPGGHFLVVWESREQDGDVEGIFGQCFTSTGVPRGAEFPINTYTTGSQQRPQVTATPGGEFIVVWRSAGQDGNDSGVFGQRLDGNCAPVAAEFQVNTYTAEAQLEPAVAAESDTHFVVVWQSDDQDGDGYGIFAQRFGAPCGNGGGDAGEECDDGNLAPCGNGLIDAGEECDDGNLEDGDCCSAACTFEAGFCDDGDACTGVSMCTDSGCVGAITAVTELTCRIEEITQNPCGDEPVPAKLVRRIGKKLRQVDRFLRKAHFAATGPRAAKVEKFRRRARKQLVTISREVGKAVRTRKKSLRISPDCQQALDALVVERDELIGSFVF